MAILVGGAQVAAGSQLDKIREKGFLVGAITDFETAPFIMPDGNTFKGFDVDLIKAIAEKLGVEAKIAALPWDGGITMAWTDGYDWSLFDIASSTITITDARASKCLFSKPYHVTGQMMVALNKDGGIKSHSDAKGKTIGILKGSTADKGAEGLGAQALPFEKYDQIISAVLDGIIDGAILDGPVAMSYTKQNPSLLLIDGLLTKEEFGVAMPSGDTELSDIINQVIEEQRDKLNAKWLD